AASAPLSLHDARPIFDNRDNPSLSNSGAKKCRDLRSRAQGVQSMPRSNRSFLLSLLVPACFAVSAGVQAQEHAAARAAAGAEGHDRKSTRLNSSHVKT